MPKNCSKDRPPVWSVPGPLPGGDVRAGGRVSSAPSFSPAEEAAARRANVLGVYEALPENVRDKRLLLIDDIVTTGSTLTECVRVLREAGAADVVCLTLARTEEEH